MDVTPIQITLWTSAFSLIGLLVGNWLRLGADRLQRRRTFRGKLRSISATLKATKNEHIYDAYQKTVPEVRDLCANIHDDVSWWWFRRSRLAKACLAYCSASKADFDKKSRGRQTLMRESAKIPGFEDCADYTVISDRLLSELDAIIHYAR